MISALGRVKKIPGRSVSCPGNVVLGYPVTVADEVEEVAVSCGGSFALPQLWTVRAAAAAGNSWTASPYRVGFGRRGQGVPRSQCRVGKQIRLEYFN